MLSFISVSPHYLHEASSYAYHRNTLTLPSTCKMHACALHSVLNNSRALQAHLSNLGPRSLAHDRPTEAPRPGTEESWFTRMLLTIGGYYSRESRLIRGAKVLYADIIEQATNRELYKGAILCFGNIMPFTAHVTHGMHTEHSAAQQAHSCAVHVVQL